MRTFGGLMAVVEALNAVGVSLFANPLAAQSRQSMGKTLVLAAVGIQVGIIMIFFAMAGVFHYRCAKAGITRRHRAVTAPLWTLYASMVLIFVRCVYRLVEKTRFTSVRVRELEQLRGLSPLLRYEWFFYVFEATLMLVNSGLWNVWHPGRFLPSSHGVHLGADGTEVTEPKGYEVSLTRRVGNGLTFGLLFRKKEKSREFIELGGPSDEAPSR
jgi:hypothetical protein